MSAAPACGAGEGLSVDRALAILQAAATPSVAIETVPLAHARGRYLAAAVTARDDVPSGDRAAVDGWAFAWTPAIGASGAVLTARPGTAAAGAPLGEAVPPGATARVLTGALPPPGTDTIAPDEACRLDPPGHVALPAGLARHANLRRAAEDLRAGAQVLAAGERLDARHLAVLAACGRAEVPVHARLEVGLVSTGDELVPVTAEVGPAATRDVNRPMLTGLLEAIGVTVRDLGLIGDRRAELDTVLARADTTARVLVVSGGAAGSEADHAARHVEAAGTWLVRRVAIRPGGPFSVGRLRATTVVLLPGNPTAALVTFVLLAKPFLTRMAGGAWRTARGRPVRAGFALDKKPGRTEYLRATIAESDDALPTVTPLARQGSGIVSVLVEADGLLELEHDRRSVGHGDVLRFLPFVELLG